MDNPRVSSKRVPTQNSESMISPRWRIRSKSITDQYTTSPKFGVGKNEFPCYRQPSILEKISAVEHKRVSIILYEYSYKVAASLLSFSLDLTKLL
ncbi:Hypothetical protein CINCED_3A017404 [Cinara cedri]|uniref:Uncharacterized protein n=1 Tax=Cinara cedri TaxID=506608 RepID=A0A5E4MPU1_9HEMI|nr:Hypothetical protein CINCED_3A017404 [Cinara cedri]